MSFERVSGLHGWRRIVPLLMVGVLAGTGLAACTGGDGNGPGDARSSGGSPGAGGRSTAAEKVTQQYLKASDPTPLASVKGRVFAIIDAKGAKVPGTVDLLAVRAGATSTTVRWRMSADEPLGLTAIEPYRDVDWRVPDMGAVTLEAKQANLRLETGHWQGRSGFSGNCTCAVNPDLNGEGGVEMSILYSALPASVTEVQLRVPGFPAVTGPVTRS